MILLKKQLNFLCFISVLLISCNPLKENNKTVGKAEVVLVRNCDRYNNVLTCEDIGSSIGIVFRNGSSDSLEVLSEGNCLLPERITHFTVDSLSKLYSYRGGARTTYGNLTVNKLMPNQSLCFRIDKEQIQHWLDADENVDLSVFSYMYRKSSSDQVYNAELIVFFTRR